jgi:predicted enzyme related to lactoylglutathione lyase
MPQAHDGAGVDIVWVDLTVDDAAKIRDLYESVIGWKAVDVDMDGYADFNMFHPEKDETVAGICHARGANANLPSSWLVYVQVADLDSSMRSCRDRGGDVIVGPKLLGGGRYCVVRDPAGAIIALVGK